MLSSNLSCTASPGFATPKVVIPLMAERSKAIVDESERVLSLAEEAFKGDGGWNSSIIDVKVDILEEEDGCIYRCEVTAIVRVQLVSQREKFHEDIGCGVSENTFKPYAVENAKKEAITDARTRALKLLLCDKGLGKPAGAPCGKEPLLGSQRAALPQAEAKEADLLTPLPGGILSSSISVINAPGEGSTTGGCENSGSNNAERVDNAVVGESKESAREKGSDGYDDDDESIFLANISDEMLNGPQAPPKMSVNEPRNEKRQKIEWQNNNAQGIQGMQSIQNMQGVQNIQSIQGIQNIQNQKHIDAPTQPPKRPFHPVVVANIPKKQQK